MPMTKLVLILLAAVWLFASFALISNRISEEAFLFVSLAISTSGLVLVLTQRRHEDSPRALRKWRRI